MKRDRDRAGIAVPQHVSHCFADHEGQNVPSRCRYPRVVDCHRGRDTGGIEDKLRRCDLGRQVSNSVTLHRPASLGERGCRDLADLAALCDGKRRIGRCQIRCQFSLQSDDAEPVTEHVV